MWREMRSAFQIIWDRLVIIFGLGAVTVSLSEFLFYQIDKDTNRILLLITYGLLSYLMLCAVHHFHIQAVAGFVIASALFGFLIEGVPVPVVYSQPPLTIVWTSLAWHALITIFLGWVILRWMLGHAHPVVTTIYCATFGAFLGVWNAYSWNASETPEGDDVQFDWQPIEPFIWQCLFGYALFLGGHILFDRFYPRQIRLTWVEHVTLWIIAAILSIFTAIAGGLLAFYPILPFLVVICIWGLSQSKRSHGDSGPNFLDRLYEKSVLLWRFTLTLAIPVGAIGSYCAMVKAKVPLEVNVIVILTTGPLSVGFYFWALFTVWRKGQGHVQTGLEVSTSGGQIDSEVLSERVLSSGGDEAAPREIQLQP